MNEKHVNRLDCGQTGTVGLPLAFELKAGAYARLSIFI